MGSFNGLLDTIFRLEQKEGPDKVIDLKDSIRHYIKPEMKLHLSSSYYYPNAIINEIIRQLMSRNAKIN